MVLAVRKALLLTGKIQRDGVSPAPSRVGQDDQTLTRTELTELFALELRTFKPLSHMA
jgi:hypothetical protein